MAFSGSLRHWARQVGQHTLTVWFAARDPRAPILVSVLALLVAAYALSPIDLIPGLIPVIGYLGDLLIVPLGLALVVRLMPPGVIEASREKTARSASRPMSYAAGPVAAVVVAF